MEKEIKSECCNAKLEGVMEYSKEEPWGAIGGHWICSKCQKEVSDNGEDIERLLREFENN
jgi:hypothetical protein